MPKDISVKEAYALTGQRTGNPTVYREDFPKRVLEIAQRIQGVAVCEIALELGIGKNTLKELAGVHKELAVALDRARTKSEADLTQRVRGAKGLDIHGMFFLKAMHGWRDRGEEGGEREKRGDGVLRIEVVHRVLSDSAPVSFAMGKDSNSHNLRNLLQSKEAEDASFVPLRGEEE